MRDHSQAQPARRIGLDAGLHLAQQYPYVSEREVSRQRLVLSPQIREPTARSRLPRRPADPGDEDGRHVGSGRHARAARQVRLLQGRMLGLEERPLESGS